MKRKIVIVSEGYPYWPKENFLQGEIKCLCDEFDIQLLPLVSPKDAVLQSLPQNVTVLKPVLKRNYFLRLCQGIFNSAPLIPFLKDFKNIFKDHKNTFKYNFVNWAATLVNSRALISNSQIKKLKFEPETAIYLYWCNYPVELFSRFPNRIFPRVHGTEFAKVASDYIPMYNEKLSLASNTIYMPISNQAAEIMLQEKPINYEINRLGVFKNRQQKDYGLKNNDRVRIVSVSYLIPKKRVHLILQALKSVKENVEWIHFGDGPLIDEISKEASSLPKNVIVQLRGLVPNVDILKFYSENYVDLFINVSEIEGVPVSIMEALSFGIPVFATDVGGTSEIVNDSNGYLAASDFNLSELTDFIENINKYADSRNLRNNAYQMWAEKSNAEDNYKQLAEILKM